RPGRPCGTAGRSAGSRTRLDVPGGVAGPGQVRRAAVLAGLRREQPLARALAVPVEQVDPLAAVARVDEGVAGLALLEHVEVLHRDRRRPAGALPERAGAAHARTALVVQRALGGGLLEAVREHVGVAGLG